MSYSRRLSWSVIVLVAAIGGASAFHTMSCRAAPPSPSVGAPEPRDARPPRTVSVSGRAEIFTTPDELTIKAGIQTYDASVKSAKKESDRRAKTMLDIAASHGVEAKCIQTEDFRIFPRFDGAYESRRTLGYDVRKRVSITVHDVETLEALLLELFDNGANELDGVQMQTTKLAELRKQAREQAMKAAKDKAEAAAAALGQRLGRPLKIEETPEPSYAGWYGRAQVANYQASNETVPSSGETTALGKIKVEAAVNIVFELEDLARRYAAGRRFTCDGQTYLDQAAHTVGRLNQASFAAHRP